MRMIIKEKDKLRKATKVFWTFKNMKMEQTVP